MPLEKIIIMFDNIVDSIQKSMEMANNSYVLTGYEISLDIIKTEMELNGMDASKIEEINRDVTMKRLSKDENPIAAMFLANASKGCKEIGAKK